MAEETATTDAAPSEAPAAAPVTSAATVAAVEAKADIKPQAAAGPGTSKKAVPDSGVQLPTYTRNLLNVKVPVTVTLTTKKQSIQQIVDLAPGSLIQFDKSCDELLDLCVGEERIAQGLAVKVGEKFGLRINNMTPPEERMKSLQPHS